MINSLEFIGVITLYLMLIVAPYLLKVIFGRKGDVLDREKLTSFFISTSIRYPIYHSLPVALFQSVRRDISILNNKLVKRLLINTIKGITPKKTALRVSSKEDQLISKILRNIVEKEVEEIKESGRISLEDYRLHLLEKFKNLESKLIILLVTYVFTPIIGLMAYSILGRIDYSIYVIIIQIAISEIVTRGMR